MKHRYISTNKGLVGSIESTDTTSWLLILKHNITGEIQ